jgi:hypothetical protein
MVNNESLIVWDGILEAADGDSPSGSYNVVWHGTLVVNEKSPDASKVEAPVRNAFKEFCDSDKEFRVTGTAQPVDGVTDGNKFKVYRMNLTEGEGWDLDGKKHGDTEHEVHTSLQWQGSSDKRKSLVFARGSDEYGSFISSGWMRPGNRITLARRYVDASSDSRAQWDAETVRKEVLKAIGDKEDCQIPPWKCSVLNTDYE